MSTSWVWKARVSIYLKKALNAQLTEMENSMELLGFEIALDDVEIDVTMKQVFTDS